MIHARSYTKDWKLSCFKSVSLADEEQDVDVEGGATLKSPAWAKRYLLVEESIENNIRFLNVPISASQDFFTYMSQEIIK